MLRGRVASGGLWKALGEQGRLGEPWLWSRTVCANPKPATLQLCGGALWWHPLTLRVLICPMAS